MPAKEKTLDDLFLDDLEGHLLRREADPARPAEDGEGRGIGRAARRPSRSIASETEGQVERLEQVFEIVGKKAQGKTCPAIQGIIEEGKEVMEEFAESEALDAGLVAAAQAVEHYEISPLRHAAHLGAGARA